MEFSSQEIIELILIFKSCGYHYEEVTQDEEIIQKFKEFEGYVTDAEGICRLTQKGELFIHQYIQGMTNELWNIIKPYHGNGCPYEIVKKTFCDKYGSEEDDIEELIEYLIKNSEVYSFSTSKVHSSKRGYVIMMDKKE